MKRIIATAAILGGLTSPALAQSQMPVDMATYTCAWFLNDLATAEKQNLAAIQSAIPVSYALGYVGGFIQSEVDRVIGKHLATQDSLAQINMKIRNECQSRPNDLLIDLIREAASSIKQS